MHPHLIPSLYAAGDSASLRAVATLADLSHPRVRDDFVVALSTAHAAGVDVVPAALLAAPALQQERVQPHDLVRPGVSDDFLSLLSGLEGHLGLVALVALIQRVEDDGRDSTSLFQRLSPEQVEQLAAMDVGRLPRGVRRLLCQHGEGHWPGFAAEADMCALAAQDELSQAGPLATAAAAFLLHPDVATPAPLRAQLLARLDPSEPLHADAHAFHRLDGQVDEAGLRERVLARGMICAALQSAERSVRPHVRSVHLPLALHRAGVDSAPLVRALSGDPGALETHLDALGDEEVARVATGQPHRTAVSPRLAARVWAIARTGDDARGAAGVVARRLVEHGDPHDSLEQAPAGARLSAHDAAVGGVLGRAFERQGPSGLAALTALLEGSLEPLAALLGVWEAACETPAAAGGPLRECPTKSAPA